MIICKKYYSPRRCIKYTKIAGFIHLLVGYGAYIKELGASVKKTTQRTICYLKTEKEKQNNEQPTHKTAHLQIAQVDTRPKFAKELFSCRRTRFK